MTGRLSFFSLRFSLCKQVNYAFSHQVECDQHLPTALFEERLQNGRTVGRCAAVPPLSCFFPPPHSSQLTDFIRLPSERTCHLLCVMFFPSPSYPPPSALSRNFHRLCLVLPRSQSIVTVLPLPLGAAWFDRER